MANVPRRKKIDRSTLVWILSTHDICSVFLRRTLGGLSGAEVLKNDERDIENILWCV